MTYFPLILREIISLDVDRNNLFPRDFDLEINYPDFYLGITYFPLILTEFIYFPVILREMISQ